MLAHAVLRKIHKKIQSTHQFAIIVDGTQDVSGVEQESICWPFWFDPIWSILRMYDATSTAGQSMASMILDVCIRLNLNVGNQKQTYDGATNMSGIYNGCQVIISEKQPLAHFVHCGAHCLNHVAQSASTACTSV